MATSLGAFLRITPWALVPALVVFLALVASFRFVSLASICAALGLPLAIFALGYPAALAVAGLAAAAIVVARHHENIQRLLAGTEAQVWPADSHHGSGSAAGPERIAVTEGRLAVVGAGAWGTALAVQAVRAGFAPRLWVFEPELLAIIRASAENPWFLPGVPLPEAIEPHGDLAAVVRAAETVVIAVPSHVFRSVAHAMAPHLDPGARVLSAAKGIEEDRLARMSQILDRGGAARIAQPHGRALGPDVRPRGRSRAPDGRSPRGRGSRDRARRSSTRSARRPSASTRRQT